MDKSISNIVNEYLDNKSKLKTSYKKEVCYFNQMLSYFESKKVYNIEDITPKLIDFFQSFLSSKKEASSVNRQFSTYNHFFKKCVEWGYLKESPCRFLRKLKENDVERILFERHEVAKILKYPDDWLRYYFYFLYMTGARPVEANNLKVKDIEFHVFDLKNKKVDGGTIVFRCRKNKGNSRKIPFNRKVKRILLRKIKNKNPDDYVFLNSDGNPIKTHNANERLMKIQKILRLKRKQIYCLRHTYLTGLCVKDTNLEKVRLLAGHRKITTTQKYLRIEFFELIKVVSNS